MNIIKTVFFAILAPGPLLIWVPYKLSLSDPGGPLRWEVFRYTAFLPWLGGTVMLLWSCGEFALRGRGTPAPIDPPKVLVGGGLYRFVRNPMYGGAFLILIGNVLWFQSLRVLVYMAAMMSAFHLFVVFYEEPVLNRQYGKAYEEYCRRVPRWVPRPKGM